MNLTSVRDLLGRYGLQADKSFGQNFLLDTKVLADIVSAAELQPTDTVLEIGPGLGVLSRELTQQAGHVISVELDRRLLPVLAETLKDYTNLSLIHGDGLEFDLGSLPVASLLVANLPYNVATPLIMRALESGRFKRLVFLVQLEVADRLLAQPGSKAFGALSLIVQAFGRAKRIRNVAPGCFYPAPEVTSSVVRIDTFPDAQADPLLFKLIHLGFQHRRKTLRKNLLMAGFEESSVEAALKENNLSLMIRAEALSLATFQNLRQHLTQALQRLASQAKDR